jgi:hypothetical protein
MKSSSTGEFVAGRMMVSAAVESAPKALSFHIGKGNDAGVPRIEWLLRHTPRQVGDPRRWCGRHADRVTRNLLMISGAKISLKSLAIENNPV